MGMNAALGIGWEGPKCRSHRTLDAGRKILRLRREDRPAQQARFENDFWNTDDPNHTYATEAIYVSIPFLISTRPGAHYGIFWDNTHRTHFNFGQVEDENHYILESEAGEIDYYFFAGDSVPEVVRAYSELTGGCGCRRAGPSAFSSAAGAT